MNIMLATSSSIPFPKIREEEDQDQMKEQRSSSPTLAAPTKNSQKRKRNLPGIPNSEVEVVALSPKALMATNRFICEVCNKGFQREQNLQLHRRGHNLPWKLRQKSTKEQKRKVYICPEPTCAHHDPSRALGDLTGVKKHFSRKHGERKYKCEKCSKRYAVQSDWKAHLKTCGTKEYRCDCGTLFSRRDSFITHRAFCDTLAQETTTHSSGLSLLGSYLYASSSHMDYINISQLGVSQIPQIQDQNHTSNLLRLGRSSSGARYQQLISPSNPPSFNQNQHNSQVIQSAPLFTSVSTHGHRESQHRIISEKPLHGSMELLPDFQNNTKNFTLNVPFNLNYMTSSMNDSENANNNGTTNLLSSTFFVSEPHMSATALLQKASQMDSATSRSSSICAADRLPMFSDFDRNFGGDRLKRSQFENDNQLQGLMNSLANGGNSVFGCGNQQYNIFDGFGGHSVTLETHNSNISFSNMEGDKMNQNLCASLGGSNGLTLDFLGVGGMVRNMGGGFSNRKEHHEFKDNSSFDAEMKPGQASYEFGYPKFQ